MIKIQIFGFAVPSVGDELEKQIFAKLKGKHPALAANTVVMIDRNTSVRNAEGKTAPFIRILSQSDSAFHKIVSVIKTITNTPVEYGNE